MHTIVLYAEITPREPGIPGLAEDKGKSENRNSLGSGRMERL